MKVGTDSIMLGSWAKPEAAQSILDIGTGSGLLAIMLAQNSRANCLILGVDIDATAIAQARENAAISPWANRLRFSQSSLQNWHTGDKYDLIITNPPYFNSPLARPSAATVARIAARQTLNLTHHQLITRVNELLSADGHFYCVLPVQNALILIQHALKLGLFCQRLLIVSARPDGEPIRYLMAFNRQASSQQIEHLAIYCQDQTYSPAYRSLCRAYYLNF